MAGKVKKIKKVKVSPEVQAQILGMNPADLAVEAAREQLSLEILKDQLKKDPQITSLEDEVKEFKEDLENIEAVIDAKQKLAEVRDSNMTEDYIESKANLKALKKSWKEDIANRSNKYKFMMRCLKKHMEAGLLKSKI